MKFLLYEIIPRAGFNLATGRFWPAGRIFDTPTLDGSISLKFLLETRLKSESFDTLDDLPGIRFQKL